MRLSPAASGAGERGFGRRRALLSAALMAAVLVVLALLFIHPPKITAGGIDFTAFYCASGAISTGANPYRYEPIHSCEHANRQWQAARAIVVAPLPPYALALLAPLGRLPYLQASFVWFLLLVVSAGVIIWAVIELTALPLLPVGIPVAIAVLLQSLPTGALAPIPLALLTAAAVTISRKRWDATAALLGLASIEPHVTLPALAAVFILVRQMRVRLTIVGALLSGISLAVGGTALNAAYFFHILPGHARVELGSIVQFGFSSMLHNFGVPNGIAIAIGSLQYAIFAAIGIWLANSLRRQNEAMVVLAPMAFAVVGGVYIHLTQIAAVLPFAFIVASQTRSALVWAGISLLTVPWNLVEAFTPTTLVVPRAGDVVSRALNHQSSPGELAYAANTLVYAGIICVFIAAISSLPRSKTVFS